jgi:hypothetical protein
MNLLYLKKTQEAKEQCVLYAGGYAEDIKVILKMARRCVVVVKKITKKSDLVRVWLLARDKEATLAIKPG